MKAADLFRDRTKNMLKGIHIQAKLADLEDQFRIIADSLKNAETRYISSNQTQNIMFSG